MKVLYISHILENSGWGRAAEAQILALDAAGVDVVVRNVTLTSDRPVSQKIQRLIKKDSEGCDVCIQHVLPHHLVRTSLFKKNVAFLEAESTSIKGLAWFEHLKGMDEVWVPNRDLRDSLVKDGLKSLVRVVPHPCDMERYTKKYNDIKIPQAEGKFKFYYIGDLNDRKNIESIVTCFHSEFDSAENAVLILKVKKFGVDPHNTKLIVDDMLNKTKSSLRMYRDISGYAKDIIISDDVSDENICSLHQYGDCFVCPSHGEAWSIPSFDAMAFGSTPICSNYGGPKDYVTNFNLGTLVGGSYSVCKCADAAFPDLFTGREYWFQPCEKETREAMRFYYEKNAKESRASKEAGLEAAASFSYTNIGNKMLGMLDD